MGKIWRPRRPAKAPPEAAEGLKDAEAVAVGKMWRPRRSAKAVGVKAAKGVAVIAVDAEVLGAPAVAAARGGEKGPLEDGSAVCLMDALGGVPVTTRQEAVGVKDAKGAVVAKMWRPRRPAKAPLEVVGVKDAVDGEVEASVLGFPVVAAARGGEKGPLEDVIAVCRMDALDGVPVTTRHEAVGVKDAEGVAVGKMRRSRRPKKVSLEAGRVKDAKGAVMEKMWRPRRPAKAPLDAVGVKASGEVAVITVNRKAEASILGAPVVVADGGGEKGPLEEGTMVCLIDALDWAPVIAMKDAEEVAVEKMRGPRQPVKAPLEAVGVKDAERVELIVIDEEVEPLVLGVPVAAAAGGGEKGSLEDGIVVCRLDALAGAPVITTDEKEEVSVHDGIVVCWMDALAGAPVITTDEKEEVSVQDGTVVCRMHALDGDPVITTDEKEEVSVQDGIVVYRMDALDGAPVITTDEKEEVSVQDGIVACWMDVLDGALVITTDEKEEVSVQDGIVACWMDALDGAPVITTDEKEEVSVQDGIVVCRMDALHGASVITTDEKEEVSAQGDPVFPTVDQKVEGVQAITVKGNGKEEKGEEGIKWLKHYSTAQSILIVGDGDFSFSLALATAFGSAGNLVATSLDSYGALMIKYGKAESNVRELKRLGATVLHDVDAKTMKLHSYLEMRRFDRIVFNFPHAGFKGREYLLRVIRAHKKLVHGFLANARQLLRPYGEIHLSHKTGSPYDAWDIEQLAYESCLTMVRKVDFSHEDYPGYNQKKGDGVTCDESFPLGPCCTFMFCVGDVVKPKQAHGGSKKRKKRNMVGSISSCLGDSKFYPGISEIDMMSPFDLHPAWSQPHFPPVHLPIGFDPCPFGVAEVEHPVNCYGTSFYHQDMVQPTHLVQPWCQEGPPIEQPWTPQEYQSLQREYEIHRLLALSLEDRYMESVREAGDVGKVDSSLWRSVN